MPASRRLRSRINNNEKVSATSAGPPLKKRRHNERMQNRNNVCCTKSARPRQMPASRRLRSPISSSPRHLPPTPRVHPADGPQCHIGLLCGITNSRACLPTALLPASAQRRTPALPTAWLPEPSSPSARVVAGVAQTHPTVLCSHATRTQPGPSFGLSLFPRPPPRRWRRSRRTLRRLPPEQVLSMRSRSQQQLVRRARFAGVA